MSCIPIDATDIVRPLKEALAANNRRKCGNQCGQIGKMLRCDHGNIRAVMTEHAMAVFNRRISVWRDTEATAPHHQGKSVKFTHERGFAMPPRFPRTDVRVVDIDSIDAALQLAQSSGRRPLVLNLADDCFPGGCVSTGSGAQEESLFRRTSLCRTLTMHFYPIRDDEAVYSPCVVVMKASEAQGFARLAEPLPTLDFVACPAIRHPQLAEGGDTLRDEDVTRLEIKVETVLQVAYKKGHGALVIGAMGLRRMAQSTEPRRANHAAGHRALSGCICGHPHCRAARCGSRGSAHAVVRPSGQPIRLPGRVR